MLYKIITLSTVAMLVTGTTSAVSRAGQVFNYQKRVGLVSALNGEHVFSIENPSVPPNTRVKLCSIKSEIPIYGIVKEKYIQPKGDQRPTVMSNLEENANGEFVHYLLESEYADISGVQLEVGVIGSDGASAESVKCNDLDGDGIPERYMSCTSREGYHSVIRSGKDKAGIKRWHVYYYFGYDVQNTCDVTELI